MSDLIKTCIEETKKKMNGFKLTDENKKKLIEKLSEIDKDKLFQTMIEKIKNEITNQPESIQNSTNDTTNQMRSEESNHNESAFKSSSNEVNPNSFGGESKGVDDIMNVDETKIKDIAEKIFQCLDDLVDNARCSNFLTTLLKD
jgi:hypothetical protein